MLDRDIVAGTIYGLRPSLWAKGLDVCQGIFRAFAHRQSTPDRLRVNAMTKGELFRRDALAGRQDYERDLSPHVNGLGVAVGPSAIGRFVVSPRVNSVKGILGWTRPHISKERGEVVSPPVAHRHATGTISPKPPVIRVVATRLGVLPRLPFLRVVTIDGVAVRSESVGRLLCLRAAAPRRSATSQRRRLDGAFGAAHTSARPIGAMVRQVGWLFGSPKNCPIAKPTSRQVVNYAPHGCGDYIRFRRCPC